jgi:hypothetical protein
MKVKVRIAVAVDQTGGWNSCGWRSKDRRDDVEMMGLACEPLEPGELQYWLTAELDVPAQTEIAADVSQA